MCGRNWRTEPLCERRVFSLILIQQSSVIFVMHRRRCYCYDAHGIRVCFNSLLAVSYVIVVVATVGMSVCLMSVRHTLIVCRNYAS